MRLLMGLTCSPDNAQSIIESVLAGINNVDVYIDDVGTFSPDWDHHIKLLGTTLCRLQENGFIFKPLNMNGPSTKLTILILAHSMGSRKKNIDAALHMDCPLNDCELHMFIGCVHYYRDMWPSHAHILKPLTDHSGLKAHAPIPWNLDMQTAFDKMCGMVADGLAVIQTITNGLMCIQMHMIIYEVLVFFEKTGQLPTFPVSCQSHSKIIR
ncbi:LOW QUALITY PROTEIN: hypothetical protein ACHAW6_000692 [Cyclotella cf. meneghiniana]